MSLLDQLEIRVGRDFTEAEIPQAEAILAYATALAAAAAGRKWDDDDIPESAAMVIVEMAFRAVTNPAGVTQDTAGPFTVSFGSDAAQRIYLTSSDRTVLRRLGKGSLWTQPVTRGPIETASVRVPPGGSGRLP